MPECNNLMVRRLIKIGTIQYVTKSHTMPDFDTHG